MLQAELNFSESNIMDMNTVNAAYINILKENKVEGVQNDYKKDLKSLISENIKDIHFNRPSDRTKPMQILSTKTKVQILSEVAKLNSHDQSRDIKILLQAAKIIRNDISKNSNWKFTGSFDDYEPPPLTYILCKHIIQGTRMIGTEQRGKDLERIASLLTQTVIQSFKSDRQVSYISNKDYGDFKSTRETPLSVVLPLTIHRKTRSKRLVEDISACLEFDKYPRIMALETRIAAAVCIRISEKDGVYLPPFVVKSKPIYFATYNIDFCESTPDGTNTLHGTITLFLKKYDDDISMVEPLYIEPINKEYVPLSDYDVQLSLLPTMKLMQPIAEKFDHSSYNSDSLIESDTQSTEKDLVWLASCHSIMKASSCSVENTNIRNEDKSHISTWAAFNSFMTKKPQETNHGVIAPLLRSPPTSPQALYTALCSAQKINACVMGN